MLYFVRFVTPHPSGCKEVGYIVNVNTKKQLAERIRDVDGEMDILNAIEITELQMVSNHVAYAPK